MVNSIKQNIGIDSGASYTRIWDGSQRVQKLPTSRSYNQYLQSVYEALKDHQPIHNLAIAVAAIVAKKHVITAVNLGEDWNERPISTDIGQILRITGEIFVLPDTEAAGYAGQRNELNG